MAEEEESEVNIYRVISEPLVTWHTSGSDVPPEDYAIAHLVAAETRSKAIWMAWKTDDCLRGSYTGDARDMPKFSARVCRKGVDLQAGIVSDDPRFHDCWDDTEETPVLNR